MGGIQERNYNIINKAVKHWISTAKKMTFKKKKERKKKKSHSSSFTS